MPRIRDTKVKRTKMRNLLKINTIQLRTKLIIM